MKQSVMSALGEVIRNHHRKLQGEMRGYVNLLVSRRADATDLIAFLRRTLLPHTCSEEQQHLYPVAASLLRVYSRSTATMAIDHEFIADHPERIERLHDGLMLVNGGRAGRA